VAQEVVFSKGGEGKIRSFAIGALLTIITFGIYGFCWYYFVNDELRDIGREKNDDGLAQSSPALSVTAIILGFLYVPWLLSEYNYGNRIKRAQRLCGVPRDQQINPTLAFLLLFPGMFLVIPYFVHYWYVTKHQNAAVRAAGGLPAWGEPVIPGLDGGGSGLPSGGGAAGGDAWATTEPSPVTPASPETPTAEPRGGVTGGDPLNG
jgi:uncharacterized membrane protein (GlpM family)